MNYLIKNVSFFISPLVSLTFGGHVYELSTLKNIFSITQVNSFQYIFRYKNTEVFLIEELLIKVHMLQKFW